MGTGGRGKEGGRKQENLEFKASQKQSESCLNKPWIEKVPPRQVVARHGRGVEGEESSGSQGQGSSQHHRARLGSLMLGVFTGGPRAFFLDTLVSPSTLEYLAQITCPSDGWP